ncbi:hypothetical protein AVEN_231121-1 [Araneus ventricosus]|uniref:Zinc finger BED domain-containing protein 5 n=1 Tax=Araneus ventricosus TaxID=182803 RepID=A0A4Y2J4Z3_ARAVE|nr:hypothetical protein AVEN_231121-1 [Araneus ventricosus]
MDKWLKTGTLKRSASRTQIRTTDLAAMELTWISKMIIMKCKGRLICLFRCTGEDIFNAIQGYFCENKIDWAKCCGVCTDGGKSMSGCYKGLRGRIKIVAPHLAWSHCCIHRQSLAEKPLPDLLKEVFNLSKL